MPRTNGELEVMLEALKEHVTAEVGGLQEIIETRIEGTRQHLQAGITRVEEQTTKHNGRMTAMEAFRQQCLGGAKIAGTLTIIIIIPLLVYIYASLNRHLDAIDTRLTEVTTTRN